MKRFLWLMTIILVVATGAIGQELVRATEVTMGDTLPSGMWFRPGRILEDGTIWFFARNDAKETYVFRSVDDGATFTYNSTPIAGRGAQLDAFDQNVALISTANGKIFRTTDGGATFTEVYSYSLGLGAGWFNTMRVLNGTTAIAMGDEATDGDAHIVRTTDGGETWTELTGIDFLNGAYGYYTWGLGSSNVGENLWIAATSTSYAGGFIYHTTDAGDTWNSYEVPDSLLDGTYIRSIAFSDANNGLLASRRGDILKTSDAGATWQAVDMHANAAWSNGVIQVPGTDIIVSADDEGVFCTDDLGLSWTELPYPADMPADYFLSGVFASLEKGYVFTDNGWVMKTMPHDRTYTLARDTGVTMGDSLTVGMNFRPGRVLDDGTIWFFGRNDAKETYVFRSVDDGVTYTYNAVAIDGRGAQLDAFDQNTALISTANGKIFRTTDGGTTFSEVYSYSLGLGSGWFNTMRVLNATTAIAMGDEATDGDAHIVRTTDGGATWTELTGIDFLNGAYGYYTWGLGSCNVGENLWIAATSTGYAGGFIYHTTDAGETWNSYTVPDSLLDGTYVRSIAFTDSVNGMLATRRGALLRTNDGGASWHMSAMPPYPAEWVNGVMAVPETNIIVAADDQGVFYTENLGLSWGKMYFPTDMPSDYFVSGLFETLENGYIFTDNGWVMRATMNPVAIDNEHDVVVVESMQLNQNYPNPFNPSTTISFEIPQADYVNLSVYDLQGRVVTELMNTDLSPGTYEVQWSGLDKDGYQVPSGIYIYTLRTAASSESRRMLLLK
ncbi:MAG: T9SS type A sorting domain-containing protein [Candidatus Marinimicrobia bacterium]|nr:T9SS type A sorting domain-containing protein [Candidatus Neomarinimicrobiota bacterium]MCF7851070.1 T9SS type A sorting domain-containing protein [Candidatus Neomarinimicrobiota bacterium]